MLDEASLERLSFVLLLIIVIALLLTIIVDPAERLGITFK